MATAFDPSEFTAFANRLADAARNETLPRFRCASPITCKDGAAFDPVTDADREAERRIRAMIAAAYPDHGIIGEEFGAERADAEWRWVLDPVDGTRAFVCGVASWATLIALERRGRAMLGVVDQPFTDERWIGGDGRTLHSYRGASRVCSVSRCENLAEARLSTTDPRGVGYFTDAEARAFGRVAARARVCRFSLDAYAYGLLALGELDLIVESSLKHHDFAALIPVVEGAGGVISGWRGEPLDESPRGRIVAAASSELHAAAIDLLAASDA
jgi:myo-inositol-1(or 4)-monophosphatase